MKLASLKVSGEIIGIHIACKSVSHPRLTKLFSSELPSFIILISSLILTAYLFGYSFYYFLEIFRNHCKFWHYLNYLYLYYNVYRKEVVHISHLSLFLLPFDNHPLVLLWSLISVSLEIKAIMNVTHITWVYLLRQKKGSWSVHKLSFEHFFSIFFAFSPLLLFLLTLHAFHGWYSFQWL